MEPQPLDETFKEIPSNPDKAQEVEDWFWEFGIKREGKFELSPGSWLDSLYRVKDAHRRLSKARQLDRAQLALWGPSQTGKSTFLSRYLDAGADDEGNGSALDWGGKPARFLGEDKDGTGTVLNPWNRQMDGSGCITYFRMRGTDEVESERPVEITLATDKQIMHALAAGFSSECSRHRHDGKSVRYWNLHDVQKLIDEVPPPEEIVLDREAYGLLHQVSDVFELLCQSNLLRYDNIDFSGDFDSLRQKILECRNLYSSVENVLTFAAELFWDGLKVFTDVYRDLSNYRQALEKKSVLSDCRVTCTFKVAAALLNIESYNDLAKGQDKAIRDLVYSIGVANTEDGLVLKEDSLDSLIENDLDFALLQGVVWGLEIPVREDRIRSVSPILHDLFSSAVIVDYPGVSNEGEAQEEDQISAASLESNERAGELFTKVLKRGKTSSIVVSSACDYDLDGFTVFCRAMGSPPGSPDQLVSGISVWWKSLTGTDIRDSQTKALPLNLNLTFFGKLISDVITNGPKNLGNILDKYDKLGPIAEPHLVDTYATTYHHVPDPDGKILQTREDRSATMEEREYALKALEDDPELQEQFVSSNPGNKTLSKVVLSDCGGVDYVLEKLLRDARGSNRAQLVNKRGEEYVHLFRNSVLARALPLGASESTARKKRIGNWIESLREILEDAHRKGKSIDSVQRLGYCLRKFLYVNPDNLAPIPLQLKFQPHFDMEGYVEEQFCAWMDDKEFHDFESIGLNRDLAVQLRSDLVDAALQTEADEYHNEEKTSIEEWVLENFDSLDDSITAHEHRSFLALKMSDAIVGYLHRKQEQPSIEDGDAIVARLFEITHMENRGEADYENSPHYFAYLGPFIKYLEEIKEMGTEERPDQPGDMELCHIVGFEI